MLRLKRVVPREASFKQNLCADIQGFSLHAAVRCAVDDRKPLDPGALPLSTALRKRRLCCLKASNLAPIQHVEDPRLDRPLFIPEDER